MREIQSKYAVNWSLWDLGNGNESDTERKIKAAIDAGRAYKPTTEQMSCPCGYSGTPEVIVEYGHTNDSFEGSRTLFYCPECGSA